MVLCDIHIEGKEISQEALFYMEPPFCSDSSFGGYSGGLQKKAQEKISLKALIFLAPRVGLEPTT
jgi:hypothetical protein